MNRALPWLLALMVMVPAVLHAQGTQVPAPPTAVPAPADTVPNPADSLNVPQKGEIETTITYSARDSINSSVDRKIVRLYGDAKIKYGAIELMAEEITIDYDNSTLTANGRLDSLGRRVGYPIFINAGEKYETKDIVYNFKTRRAKISEVVTKQGNEGIMHGAAVFKNEKNELLSVRNAYTTCDLPHPHYSIISTRAKAIPGDKIVSGPFYMEFNEVPLPAGFLFGIFPSPKKSSSGVIIPTYGEERNRGFFLRNGGYYFDINDYVKLRLTGDLYSLGSSAVYLNSTYTKRYAYQGSFNFSYTSNYTSSDIENRDRRNDFRLMWSHSPKTRGTSRFSASVNAATSSFNSNNYLGVNTNPSVSRLDNTTRKLSSNISYSKTFGNVVTLGVNFRHNQDVSTGQVDLPLPDMSLNVNNLYPFKKIVKGMFFENMALRYSMAATNQITNNLGRIKKKDALNDSIAPFNMTNLPTFIERGKKGIRHTIPISTSFKALRYFTFTPSITIDELWYFEKLRWGLSDDGKKAVVTDTLRGFNRVTNFSTSVSLTTRIYGTVFFKKDHGVKAIRHVINPTVGFSYQPNYTDPSYGYYQPVQLLGTNRVTYKSVHEGFAYGPSRSGAAAAMSFGLNNTIEMKVRTRKDTIDRKVPLFNSLSANTSYNFLADSFRIAPISLAANTNVFQDMINLNMSASLDPYQYVTLQKETLDEETGKTIVTTNERRVNQLVWETYRAPAGYTLISKTPFPGRITSANLALSTNLNSKGQKKDAEMRERLGKSNANEADKNYLMQHPEMYIDFTIPWNLRMSYNVNYSRGVGSSGSVTQSLTASGDFSISEKWKIQFTSGYDFQNKEITQTNIVIARDLHCWDLRLDWVPFGKYQSYNFYIAIKSSLLKDLKVNRTRSFFDN